MTIVKNNFLGTPGVAWTVANSGGEGDPFDTFGDNSANGVVFQYASASGLDRPTAETVLEMSTGNSAYSPAAVWTTSFGSQSQVYVRFYVQVASAPASSQTTLPYWFHLASGGLPYLSLGYYDYSPFYWIAVTRNAQQAGEAVSYFTTNVQWGKWLRFEIYANVATSGGTIQVDFYDAPNADSDTPTETKNINHNFPSNSVDMYMVGQGVDRKLVPTTYFSGFALSNEGWIGPAPFHPGSRSVPGVLSTPVAVHSDAR